MFFSERKSGRRKRSSDGADNLEEDYEQRLSKRSRDDADDIEVRELLPVKCKQMGIVRRTVEINKSKLD